MRISIALLCFEPSAAALFSDVLRDVTSEINSEFVRCYVADSCVRLVTLSKW